jgi:hypothetical protein
METIIFRKHVGDDGILKLELPIGETNVDCEISITVRSKMSQDEWAAFIEETAGSLADDPIERPAALPLDIRDEIE